MFRGCSRPVSAPWARWLLLLLGIAAVIGQVVLLFRTGTRATPASDWPTFTRTDCLASTKGGKPSGSGRDCGSGQGTFCTLQQPCTPCTQGGCTRCSDSEFGNCRFVMSEEVGPYCAFPLTPDQEEAGVGTYLSDGRRVQVGPCTKCCSD